MSYPYEVLTFLLFFILIYHATLGGRIGCFFLEGKKLTCIEKPLRAPLHKKVLSQLQETTPHPIGGWVLIPFNNHNIFQLGFHILFFGVD